MAKVKKEIVEKIYEEIMSDNNTYTDDKTLIYRVIEHSYSAGYEQAIRNYVK